MRSSTPMRVAFLGRGVWLDGCCPPEDARAIVCRKAASDRAGGVEQTLESIREFQPDVTVVFDPASALPGQAIPELPGVTVGVLVGEPSAAEEGIEHLDRLVSFRPQLTGTRVGGQRIWRAIPPPVADSFFNEARPLHARPRAITIGRSTAHREAMLLPAKHHHDVFQAIHGVTGSMLAELLAEYDVGIYVGREPGGGFGAQVTLHLAAGHLLLCEHLAPAHGLERNIDYLQVDSPHALVWTLDRLSRFPEMHRRISVRGRLKAEQYRASRLFQRIAHDVVADVRAFGAAGG